MGRTESGQSRSRSFSKSDSQISNDSPIERTNRRGIAHSKTNIYICPVPWNYTRAKLVDLFKKFGETSDSMILTKTRWRGRARGRRNPDGCVGFVDFKRNSSARRAIKRYNGAKMRTVFSNYKGETRMVVRFADARSKRPDRRRPDRARRRDRGEWQRNRNRRRGRNRFSSQSRSRSRKRIKKERSESGSKKIKDESPSPSDGRRTSRSRGSGERSISSDRSRSRSRDRYTYSSEEESVKVSESEAQKQSQRGSSADDNPPTVPPETGSNETRNGEVHLTAALKVAGQNIIVCCNNDERSVLINPPKSPNPSAQASRSDSVHSDSSSKLLPVPEDEDISSPLKQPKAEYPTVEVDYNIQPTRLEPELSDDQSIQPLAQATFAEVSKAEEAEEEPLSPVEQVDKGSEMRDEIEQVDKVIEMQDESEQVDKGSEMRDETEQVDKVSEVREEVEQVDNVSEMRDEVDKVSEMRDEVEQVKKVSEMRDKENSPVYSTTRASVIESPQEDQEISPVNEKEWESFQKFKKMRIRVRWQAYQQYQGQVKLLETKNLELEEDLQQLEGQCRYWKDKFKRTLREYRDSKDHLRKARRFTFEEEATIV